MCSYNAPYIHMYPMHVVKNAWNSHHFGQFFRRERDDAVSRFFESLQRAKVKLKIRCITSTIVVGWG